MRKLEVGSGSRPIPGYEHLDINPNCPDLQYNAPMHEIPTDDNTFDEVKSVHVIEHVPRHLWLPTLREWLRVLKPGGKCVIDTPNLMRNAQLYTDPSDAWLKDFNSLTPAEQEAVSIDGVPNRALWYNFKTFSSHVTYDIHYGNFDAALLLEYCRLAGFIRGEVDQYDPSLIVVVYKADE